MPDPDFSPLGARLRDRTRYLQENDADYGYAHSHLCEAMLRGGRDIATLVDPPDPYHPWAPLFNVDICPPFALPWLAQIVGIRLPSGLTADQQRAFIKGLAFMKRGSPAAIRATIQSGLTGTRMVWFRERDQGDPYRLEAIVRTSEIATSLEAIRQMVVRYQKPAGIVFSIRSTATWDYQEMTTDYVGRTYNDIPGDYPKYGNLTGGPLA